MPGRRGPQAALVAFAVRFRGIVLALSLALAGYGIVVPGAMPSTTSSRNSRRPRW